MARFCTNCGAKLGVNARFCGNCGAPCARVADGNRQPVRAGVAARRNGSGGWGKFFAGGFVGALFTRLFGGSHGTASSYHSTDTTNNFHNTAIYHADDDDLYFSPREDSDEFPVDEDGIPAFAAEDEDTSQDSEDFAADDGDFDDGHDDDCGDDYDDGHDDYDDYGDSGDYDDSDDYGDD